MAAKFTVYFDKSKKFRFNLKATNGQIIASSEAYETKTACLNGIKSIQKNAPTAALIDETVEKKEAVKKAPAKRSAGTGDPGAKKAGKPKAVKPLQS